jgi:predicted RND superfamily exporter protein/glutaredoxin
MAPPPTSPRRFDLYTRVIEAARRLDRHYLIILLFAVALTVAAVRITRGLRFDSDLANLLPPTHPDLKILRKIQAKYSSDTGFIVLLSKNYVFIADEAGAIRMHNGKNWIPMPAGGVVRSLHGFSSSEVFGVGDGGRFVRFDPRGPRFVASETGVRVTLRGLWGSAPDRLLAVGDGGTLLRFDGKSWRSLASGTRAHLRAISGSGGTAYAVGDGGTLLRIEGERVEREVSPIDADLAAVWVDPGSGEVVAAGSRGTLLHRHEQRWEAIATGTSALLHGVWGSGPREVYAAGEGGIVLRWDGEKLRRGATRTRAELRAIHGTRPDDIWAVGDDCTIRRNLGYEEWSDGPIDSTVGKAVFRWYAVFLRQKKAQSCTTRLTAVYRPSADLGRAKALAPKLAAALEASKRVSRVDWKKPLRFFWDRAFYYAQVKDLEKVRDTIEESLEKETAKGTGLYVDLEEDSARTAPASRPGKGPDLEALLKKYRAEVGQLGTSEWYEHPDGTSLGLIVYPAHGLSDLESLRPMKAEIERIVSAAGVERSDPLLRWDIGGDGVNKILEYDATLFDIFGTLWIPVVGITLLIILYFRRLVGLLLSMVPLGMSIAWTAALTTLTIGTLNFVTGFLFAVLTGLGIDYGIQLFGRYREGRCAGLSPEAAMDHVVLDTGRATLTSAITTAVALLTMCITEFRGFSEFGFIAGLGIVLALASYLLVLPALIFLFERLGLLRFKVERARATSEVSAPGQEPFRLPRVVLVVSALITIYGIYGATQLSFEHDTRKLRNVRQADEIENRSGRTFGQSFTPTMFLAGSRDELEAGVAGIRRRVESFGKESRVGRIVSILDLVPPRQHEKRTVLDAIDRMLHDRRWNLVSDETKARLKLDELRRMARARPFTLEALPKEVRRAFRGPGFGEVWLGLVFYTIDVGHILHAKQLKEEVGAVPGDAWVHLGSLVPGGARVLAEAGRAEIACPPAAREACIRSVRQRLGALRHEGKPVIGEMVETGEAYRRGLAAEGGLRGDLLALARPGFILRGDRAPAEAVIRPSGIYHVSSGELVLVEVVEVMLRDGKIAFALAFLAVLVSALIDFRSLRLTLLSFVPLGLGFLWAFGLMELLHLKLNMFNFVILPALLGIGVDYGVHYLHRYREEGEGNLGRVMRSLYWVIFFCAVTTVVGFGNVTFAAQPGLKSLGNLAIIGITCIFFAATYTLPALLYAIERWRGVRSPAAVAATVERVVVYAASYCPSSRLVRRFLGERGVAFAWIEVDTLPQPDRERIAKELVAASGADELPVTRIADLYVVGFDPAAIAAALAREV